MKTSFFPPWSGFLSLSLTLVLPFSWKMVTPCAPCFVHKPLMPTLNDLIHQWGFGMMMGQAVTTVSKESMSPLSLDSVACGPFFWRGTYASRVSDQLPSAA